jgi:RNA polymerase sigma-70 factor (ECF subfamily)
MFRDSSEPVAPEDPFPSTQWSLIVRAAAGDTDSRTALAELCGRYWYPVYAFIRRRTGSAEQAEDLTQGFFAHLLDGDRIAGANPARGRFRAYLVGSCRNYLADRHRRAAAVKRGGAARRVPLDYAAAAHRFGREPETAGDPERLFLRAWALTVLERAGDAVRAEYAAAGRAPLFDRLRPALTGDPEAGRYRAIADEFDLTENAVKKAAQQLRQRYAAELRRQVGDTLADPREVDDEIRELFAAVSG